MGYLRSLDEYDSEELLKELQERDKKVAAGLCDYCGRPVCALPYCKFPARHVGPNAGPPPPVLAPSALRPKDKAVLPFEVTIGYRQATLEEFDHQATGAAARGARLVAGLRLREIAAEMGCSLRYVSVLERGEKKWSWKIARRYGDALRALTTPKRKSKKKC